MLRRMAVFVLLVALPAANSVWAAEMALVPAQSSGPFTIEGNQVFIPVGGVRVELDVIISGWAPELLGAAGADLAMDGSSFSGGTLGSLSFFRPACAGGGGDCVAAFGPHEVNCHSASGSCWPGYIDTGRSDYAGFDLSVVGFSIFGMTPVSFELFGVDTLAGIPDSGPKYLGTFVIDVPPGATGTFTVNLLEYYTGGSVPASGMINVSGDWIVPLNLVPALITIGPPPGGTCTGDVSPVNGIQDSLEDYPEPFTDDSTTPYTRGSIVDVGNQDLCISDAPNVGATKYGIRAKSLGTIGGGSSPASVKISCFVPTTAYWTEDITTGDCVTMTCRVVGGVTVADAMNSCPGSASSSEAGATNVAAATAASEVTVKLLSGGLVVGTVVLPEPNTVSYAPVSREVTAPSSNTTTLTVATPSGDQLPLAPGGTATLPPPATIPAASTWGLVALSLVLLAGAKIYFGRRRATHA